MMEYMAWPEFLQIAKYFRNHIKSNQNQIVYTIFQFIKNQTNIRFVQNRSENGKHSLISI